MASDFGVRNALVMNGSLWNTKIIDFSDVRTVRDSVCSYDYLNSCNKA